MSGRSNEREALIDALAGHGFDVVDMTGNEMAKLHVRFMVGGPAKLSDERLLRFEFPERPGALIRFLDSMGGRWNISLFHYRNHGAAVGRVLVGLQVPASDQARLEGFLRRLGYPWIEETENPAHTIFLGGR